jgi:hypothetical protein
MTCFLCGLTPACYATMGRLRFLQGLFRGNNGKAVFFVTCTLHVNLYIFTNNGRTMTMTNDRPDRSSEGAHAIDKTILVNVNRNKYPVMRPTWALKPGLLTDRLVVGRNVTLTLTLARVSYKDSYQLVSDGKGRHKSWLQQWLQSWTRSLQRKRRDSVVVSYKV